MRATPHPAQPRSRAPTAACLAGPPAPPGAAAVCALHRLSLEPRPTATCLPGPPAPPGAAARQRTDVRPHRALCQAGEPTPHHTLQVAGQPFAMASPSRHAARAVRDSRHPRSHRRCSGATHKATAGGHSVGHLSRRRGRVAVALVEMTALTLVAMLVLYVDHATANVLAGHIRAGYPSAARCASTRPSLPPDLPVRPQGARRPQLALRHLGREHEEAVGALGRDGAVRGRTSIALVNLPIKDSSGEPALPLLGRSACFPAWQDSWRSFSCGVSSRKGRKHTRRLRKDPCREEPARSRGAASRHRECPPRGDAGSVRRGT